MSDEDKDKNNKLVFENRSRRDNLEKILPPELMVKLEKIKSSWYNDVIGKYIPEAHPKKQASRRRTYTANKKAKELKKEQEKLKLKPTVIPKKKKIKPIGKNYPEGKKGKPYVKKAGSGKVKNRNIGGVIGGGLNSQDVVDYLYKYKS